MAIVQNFWLQGASKRLAGAVLYEAMGQTRARQLATSVSNPRTEAQMTQRIKWANLVNFYRANRGWMKYAFEAKKSNQSEYNAFMSRNVTASTIALTKDMAAAGACVAYPYIITQGSLPSVEWYNSESVVKSNIYLAPNNTMDDYNVVGEFARDIIAYNPGVREGDQLSLIRVTQMTNNVTGYPYIVVREYEVLMDTSSTQSLYDFIPESYFSADGSAENNTLNVPKTNRQGGFAVILSRTIGGKTYVSSQNLVMVNNEVLISQYSSNQAVQAAIDSYGESSDAFLSSVSAAAATQLPVSLAINYVQFPNGILTAGSTTPTMGDIEDEVLGVVFNDTIPTGAVVSGSIVSTTNNAYTISNASIEGNRVDLTVPTFPEGQASAHVLKLIVRVNNVDYEIKFAGADYYTLE